MVAYLQNILGGVRSFQEVRCRHIGQLVGELPRALVIIEIGFKHSWVVRLEGKQNIE